MKKILSAIVMLLLCACAALTGIAWPFIAWAFGKV